jgi:hypothetical protein
MTKTRRKTVHYIDVCTRLGYLKRSIKHNWKRNIDEEKKREIKRKIRLLNADIDQHAEFNINERRRHAINKRKK